MNTQPASYYRHSKNWQQWIGRSGKVVASTLIRVASPEFQELTPYSFVIVDVKKSKSKKIRQGFVGVAGQEFGVGDQVVCVFRQMGKVGNKGLIRYGIKVKKYAAT